MIKANELRIGNLIKWISTQKIEQVKDIETLKRKNININNVSISDCVGIELTEEWLGRLGFRNENGLFILISELPKSKIFIHGIYGKYYMTYGAKENQYIQIEYVHQLQNICFCLTGEELKIN